MEKGAHDVLRKKELELFIFKLAKLRTKGIMDSDMFCVSPDKCIWISGCSWWTVVIWCGRRRNGGFVNLRKVRNSERRIGVEVIRLYEAL